MINRKKLKKVLLLGSGALKIGEAGEFDYSGSQAAKALREEGIETILINPNIATIQTSKEFTSKIYFLPVTAFFTEKVIKKEKPDGILLGFGGQTALNCGLELAKKRIYSKYNVEVLGTPVSAIEKTEDRLLFRKQIIDLGLKVPQSNLCGKISEVRTISKNITYPVIVRAGFSLGGLGSGIARNPEELVKRAHKALALTPQILVEEYLEHWKEIEYEVVRDQNDNTITVCNMENLDPMGIHTGESIVVAPSQTLTNSEYHSLREIAIKVVKSLPIIGECNIQYGLNPTNGDYRIIEVNARLSRSSALASKATGYSLAYIAAKLSIGYSLDEIKNKVTGVTSAFFEPALDYLVVKIPRWDFLKFKNINDALGSEMQSVGEVMSIGRSFAESLQKAVRSLDLEYQGVISDDLDTDKIIKSVKVKFKPLTASPSRLYYIAFNIFHGQTIEQINKETGIDLWFLREIAQIVNFYKKLLDIPSINGLSKEILIKAKQLGFSDQQLANIFKKDVKEIRGLRKNMGITPKVCQIDTLAGEFPAKTNYLYFSYLKDKHDIIPGQKNQIGVIGGGPYQIGSSVEFDWCAVNSVITAKKQGYSTIMINSNPETVSTDYDISDKLYFEELTPERILDISDIERCPFIISVGGQIPNTMAPELAENGIKLLGTDSSSIDRAEDRQKFSALLDDLHIIQPAWKKLTTREEAVGFAGEIGFPVLVRPSYVLSGKAMVLAYTEKVLESYLEQNVSIINPKYPVVISKFIRGAKEVDFDAVAQDGEIQIFAISEHVENAGVHSGDATLVLPSFSLSQKAKDIILMVSKKITKALKVNGPYNIQYLVENDDIASPRVLVIEANLRASRSFPFVSKVTGTNFIELATKIMLNKPFSVKQKELGKYFGIKAPHFSFTRLREVDPVLRVEMASTGEVACFGDDIYEAYLKSLLSTGINFQKKAALLSLGGEEGKERMVTGVRTLNKMGFEIYATNRTAQFIKNLGIPVKTVFKVYEGGKPNVVDIIKDKKVGLVVNLSDRSDLGMKELTKQISDGYLIRRATVDANIPLLTRASIANLLIESLARYRFDMLKIKSWDEYVENLKTQG